MIEKTNPKELIRLAKNGDKNAFGLLYKSYYVPIFRYIYARIKNKEDTEDLVQTVFMKAYRSIQTFKEKNQEPLAYFFTVARNTVIDYFRKSKYTSVKDVEFFENIADHKGSPEELFEQNENSKFLYKSIQELSENQREIIILKFINELSNKEIANLLGKKEDAIRQMQSRALKVLREKIRKDKIK